MSTRGKVAWNKGKTKADTPALARVAKAKAKWWAASDRKQTRKRIGAKSKGRLKGVTGSRHPGWRGGRYTTKRDGYVYVYAPEHPDAVKATNGVGGYMLEHRLVMEKIVGRRLHPDEDVNHKNGVKNDNRPENLRLVSHYAHFEEHGCPSCGFRFFTK